MPAPEDIHALAVTEKGSTLDNFTFADIEASLTVLILNGGNMKRTLEILGAEGIMVSRDNIRFWRDNGFPQRFRELRSELGATLSEDVAARAMERAVQADDAEELYIQAAVDRIDEVTADKLAPAVSALAKAKSDNITKAQLLRDRPTEIREVRDTSELLDVLRRSGVLARDPLNIDAEDVEILPEESDEMRSRIAKKLQSGTDPV